MNVKKMIFFIYSFLTVFSLLSVLATTLTLIEVLPAILLMWLLYLIFNVSYNAKTNETNVEYINKEGILERITKHRFIVLIVALICSVVAAHYYTGNNPIDVILATLRGQTLYFDYQQYFNANQIGAFSLSKMPFILMNAMLNLLFVVSIICTMTKKGKLKISDYVFMMLMSAIFAYFGLARGTNFEFFQMICLFFYVLLNRMLNQNRNRRFKILFLVSLVGVIGIIIFSSTMSNRGFSGYYITDDISYDRTSSFSSLFPNFSMAISRMTPYFGFGFKFVSTFLTDYLFSDFSYLFASFIPFGFVILGESPVHGVGQLISCGTNWRPDVVQFTGYTGFIGLFVACYVLGRVAKKTNNILEIHSDILQHMILYYILLQAFSLPIGNFIMISSANMLIVFGIIILCISRKVFFRKKIVFHNNFVIRGGSM